MEQKESNQNAAETLSTIPDEPRLSMRIGNTTYLVGIHFSETSKDTLADKVKKLIRRDLESENF